MTSLKLQKIETTFAPETAFTVTPQVVVLTERARMERELEFLKNSLLGEIFQRVHNPEHHSALHWAANSAASLAWLTPYPLLILPVLLEEKAREALERSARQILIRQRSQSLVSLAA